MENQTQNAVDPETGREHKLEYHASEVVRQAILNLDYPDEGLRVRDAVIKLANEFGLTDDQKNALTKSKLNVFRYNVVAPQFRRLLSQGKLVQPEGPKTPYFLADEISDASENNRSMEMVSRKAFNQDTGQEYEIKIPAIHIVKKALLEYEYPDQGIKNMDVANSLAEEFELNEEQRNAKHRNGYKIYLNNVNTAIKVLVKSGKLLRIRRGWIINPDQPEEITPDDTSCEGQEKPAPQVTMERNYREIQNQLRAELLQKVKANTPDFFEELVLDLLVEMGYGGSRADAEAVGRAGDGGIDGIIKEDSLGLEVVYVQAKRWEHKVPDKEIRDFTGALTGKGAQKGIFITTSDFTQPAIEFAETMTCKRIILVNGDKLVKLMIDYNIGVSSERTYEIKQLDPEYFGEEGRIKNAPATSQLEHLYSK